MRYHVSRVDHVIHVNHVKRREVVVEAVALIMAGEMEAAPAMISEGMCFNRSS